MLKKIFVSACFMLVFFNVDAQSKKDTAYDLNAYFKPLKWRNIGPFRGGRSVTATGVVGDVSTYYMGTTGGGLWKTEDMGINWANISDGYFKTGSVGAVAVAKVTPMSCMSVWANTLSEV